MNKYNVIYNKLITEQTKVLPSKMTRSKFYSIREYKPIDGVSESYNAIKAPIIFTLYVSRVKDIVHAVKLSEIRPDLTKRFFGKFVDEDISTIVMKGTSKQVYHTILRKMPFITENAYRTYKLSGLKRVFELDIKLDKITPRDKKATDLDDRTVRDTLEETDR